jgi:hypothetical protein
MSWCLADVFDVYGDIGPSIGGIDDVDASPDVIYPDKTPTVNELLPRSREEMPGTPSPPQPPEPGRDLREPFSPPDRDNLFPLLEPMTDEPLSQAASAPRSAAQQKQRRWRDRLPFGRPRDSTADATAEVSERAAVAPVQYLKPGAEPPSWKPDRRRLPGTD